VSPVAFHRADTRIPNIASVPRNLPTFEPPSVGAWDGKYHSLQDTESGSSRNEPVVAQGLAANEPPSLPGLHFQHTTIGHSVAELRMAHFRIQPPKPRFPEWLSSPVRKKHSARVADEILRAKFSPIDKTDSNAVGDERSKLLHQI